MKLNPPGSSSDLEVARAVARRLHHRARGTEPVPTSTAPATPPPPAVVSPPELRTPEPPPSPPRQPVVPPPVVPPPVVKAEPTDPQLEPQPPELDAPELEPDPPEPAAPELEPVSPELAAPDLEPEPPRLETPEPPAQPPEPLFEPDGPVFDEPAPAETEAAAAYAADTGEFPTEPPGVADEQENVFEQLPPGGYGPATGSFEAGSNEQPSEDTAGGDDALADLAAPPSPGLEGLAPPEFGVSPEDLLPEQPTPPGWSDPSALEAELMGSEVELVAKAEAPVEATSPWDDVADSCLALAPALGAMLVDPTGQVLTSRGDWPEPGPEAIAGRLASMMDKKLRDAPTRSVSAPLAGQHLTAWRVPAGEGYLTIVFMADAPLKADIRPAIDTAIQAAGG